MRKPNPQFDALSATEAEVRAEARCRGKDEDAAAVKWERLRRNVQRIREEVTAMDWPDTLEEIP